MYYNNQCRVLIHYVIKDPGTLLICYLPFFFALRLKRGILDKLCISHGHVFELYLFFSSIMAKVVQDHHADNIFQYSKEKKLVFTTSSFKRRKKKVIPLFLVFPVLTSMFILHL